MPEFEAKLFQSHWQRSNTETFTIEAENAEEAQQKADEIAKEKGLEQDFDFEINEIVIPDLTPVTEEETTEGEKEDEQR